MNSRQFFDLVKLARHHAKAYMQDKDPEHIKVFHSAIAEIDAEIERVEGIMEQQNK